MTFDEFKTAWEKSAQEHMDGPDHGIHVAYEVMTQFVESHVAGLRDGLREIGDKVAAQVSAPTPPTPPPALEAKQQLPSGNYPSHGGADGDAKGVDA